MYTISQVSWFFIVFIWIDFAKCETECAFNNLDYKSVVAGIEGKVNPSEPLHKDIIAAELPTLKYSLLNVTFKGMKDCEVIYVQCNENSKNELTFQYNLQCPQISLIYDHEVYGNLDSLVINGKGSGIITFEDYVLMFDGIYENVIGKDQKRRPVIKDHTVDMDPKGIVKFNIYNLDHGDKEREARANKFLNENWREMEKLARSPTISSFMDLFIENVNAASKAK